MRINPARIGFYLVGLLLLALGIVLNTQSGLGASPIISVAYSTSIISGFSFGDTTFALYAVFVVVEMIIHTIQSKRGNLPNHEGLGAALLMDVLQLPLSLIFTRFINLFTTTIPAPKDNFVLQFAVLLLGVICTGIGAAMSLNMRLIPNPGDGIVQTIADTIHRPVGFTKNCFDVCNVAITICIGLAFAHQLIGIGVATVVAVIGVGRVIAVFNRLFMDRLLTAAGM